MWARARASISKGTHLLLLNLRAAERQFRPSKVLGGRVLLACQSELDKLPTGRKNGHTTHERRKKAINLPSARVWPGEVSRAESN